MITPQPLSRMCWICGQLVELETCKTDEHGNAVHGPCYEAKMSAGKRAPVAEKAPDVTFQMTNPASDGDGSILGLTYPEWQKPLHAALMETDHSLLKQKVLDAEVAVFKRKQQLANIPPDGGASQMSRAALAAELMAISDALSSLNMLRRELVEKSAS